MTTSVTVEAHPTSPNNAVEVTIYSNDDHGSANYVLLPGATHTFTLHGEQTLNVREENTQVIGAILFAGGVQKQHYDATPMNPQPTDPATAGIGAG